MCQLVCRYQGEEVVLLHDEQPHEACLPTKVCPLAHLQNLLPSPKQPMPVRPAGVSTFDHRLQAWQRMGHFRPLAGAGLLMNAAMPTA